MITDFEISRGRRLHRRTKPQLRMRSSPKNTAPQSRTEGPQVWKGRKLLLDDSGQPGASGDFPQSRTEGPHVWKSRKTLFDDSGQTGASGDFPQSRKEGPRVWKSRKMPISLINVAPNVARLTHFSEGSSTKIGVDPLHTNAVFIILWAKGAIVANLGPYTALEKDAYIPDQANHLLRTQRSQIKSQKGQAFLILPDLRQGQATQHPNIPDWLHGVSSSYLERPLQLVYYKLGRKGGTQEKSSSQRVFVESKKVWGKSALLLNGKVIWTRPHQLITRRARQRSSDQCISVFLSMFRLSTCRLGHAQRIFIVDDHRGDITAMLILSPCCLSSFGSCSFSHGLTIISILNVI